MLNSTSPSTTVNRFTAKVLSGWRSNTAKSASFPTSMEPTRSPIPRWIAALIVIVASACSSVIPPHFTVFAASWFRWRASSALSELMETSTPRSAMSAALWGMAS